MDEGERGGDGGEDCGGRDPRNPAIGGAGRDGRGYRFFVEQQARIADRGQAVLRLFLQASGEQALDTCRSLL